jgi:hypothetical protein
MQRGNPLKFPTQAGTGDWSEDFGGFARFVPIASRLSKQEFQMLKSIVGVIVGYIAMAIFAFAIFTCAYLGLGVDRVFEPESYAISTMWIVIMIVVSLVGGIIGGLVCAAISKSKGACTAFAVIVLALGLIVGIPAMMKEHSSEPRSGDVSNLQAMSMAQNPAWLCLLNPVIGAAGVLLGARMKKLPTA